jgi:hypothetical protein
MMNMTMILNHVDSNDDDDDNPAADGDNDDGDNDNNDEGDNEDNVDTDDDDDDGCSANNTATDDDYTYNNYINTLYKQLCLYLSNRESESVEDASVGKVERHEQGLVVVGGRERVGGVE